jgi:hypothetical protein
MSKLKRLGTTHKRDHDYLPTHIGESFQSELVHLTHELAKTEGFKGAYLRDELLSKYVDSSTTPADVRRQAAITKWLLVEEKNQQTNIRLLIGDEDFGWTTSDALINKAREVISSVLGKTPPEEILSTGTHTFGASTRVGRGPQAAFFKHVGKAHVTSRASGLFCLAYQNSLMSDQELEIQESSVMFTVPKSSDIDRVACKEPEINMLLQRCVGSFIRKRLKQRANISLNDQRINQRLARDAYRDNLATIDLSSASDSITRQLVVSLLPTDWWFLLDRIRVHSTIIDGETHDLEMFSSMGNGFTFELESLLFYALMRAVCWASGTKGRISVYGDDLIMPSSIAARFSRVMSWFGFVVNTKKSNWTGGFRESCGEHYYYGRTVTPFYLRGPVRKKSDIIRILNRLLVWDGYLFQMLITPSVITFHLKWSKVIPVQLHGGIDPERIDSLVTGSPPRKRLLWRGRDLTRHELGAYKYWLSARKANTGGEFAFFSLTSYDVMEGLTLTPQRIGRPVMDNQPKWCSITTWTPYALAEAYTT